MRPSYLVLTTEVRELKPDFNLHLIMTYEPHIVFTEMDINRNGKHHFSPSLVHMPLVLSSHGAL